MQMQEILQQQQVNKKQMDLQYLISDKIHIRGVEPVLEDLINKDPTVVQTMLAIIQATSYLLEIKTSKIKLIKCNIIINKLILTIKTNYRLK